MNYDKPFKTYDEQISHLKNVLSLQINDESFAKQALKSFSYYDLINGYKDIFMVNDIFKSDITFEYLYVFNNFNINMQSILFKYSVIVENIFKNNLAYILSQNFGVDYTDYLNYENYINPKDSKKRKLLFELLNKLKATAQSTVAHPSKYYRENHNHLPAWILFKNLNFGWTIDLVKFIKSSHKHELYHLLFPQFIMENNELPLISSLTIIRKYRNVIAHNLKFITFKPKLNLETELLPKIFHNHLLVQSENKCELNGIYSFIISLLLMLGDPILINTFIQDIQELTNKYYNQESVLMDFFTITGIPLNIMSILNSFILEYQKLIL